MHVQGKAGLYVFQPKRHPTKWHQPKWHQVLDDPKKHYNTEIFENFRDQRSEIATELLHDQRSEIVPELYVDS